MLNKKRLASALLTWHSLVFLYAAAACKTPSMDTSKTHSNAEVATIKVPASPQTWLFTWTFNQNALANPKQFILDSLQGVPEANKNGNGAVEGMQAGNGLYFAGDPLQSFSFGNVLVAVQAAPGMTAAYSNSRDISDSAIQSSHPGLFYLWGGGTTFVGEYAIVAREKSLLQLNSALAAGGKPPLNFAQKTSFVANQSSSWQDILNHFFDVMSLISDISDGENDRKKGADAYTQPMLDSSGKLNKLGILRAINAEFYHGHRNVQDAYNKLMGPKLNAVNMPYCTKELATANERAKKYKTPCFWSIMLQISRTLNNEEPLDNQYQVKFPEAALVMQTAGYLSPTQVPKTFKELGENILANFAASTALNRAQEAVDAYQILKNQFSSWSLHQWANKN